MSISVLTQRNGVDRRGVNDQETILNPTNVSLNTFGMLGIYPVDGDVYAQPLYVPKVATKNGGTHALVIVATMGNTVFAFDADASDFTKAQIWKTNLGPPVFAPQFRAGKYLDIVDAVASDDFRKHTATIGILSTPVVDAHPDPAGIQPTTGLLYVVTFNVNQAAFEQSKSAAEFQYFLHALRLEDGSIARPAVRIEGSVSGSGYVKSAEVPTAVEVHGNVSSQTVKVGGISTQVVDATNLNTPNAAVQFNAIMQLQRPALLLHEGKIIIAFGSRGDEDPYHGWVFAYDAQTFSLAGLFCTTPNGARGGIWQAGQGLLVDSKGQIYAGSGNGDSRETVPGSGLQGRNLGESFVQLLLDATGLRMNSWFNAFDDFLQKKNPGPQSDGDQHDDDLGASAPALLPDDRIVGGGKDGWFYLIDPDLLDKTGSPNAVPQAFKASFNFGRGSRNTVDNQGRDKGTHHIHGTPVVWNSISKGTFVFVWGENDVVRVYQYATEANGDPNTGRFIGQPPDTPPGQAPVQGIELSRGVIYASNEVALRNGMPGGMLSLTWDGTHPESAILWASYPPFYNGNFIAVEGSVAAYSAFNFDTNLAFKRLTLLWHSLQHPDDDFGLYPKFCCPTIANGRLYQATASKKVVVYGPKPPNGGYQLGFGGATGLTINGTARVTRQQTILLTEHAHHQVQDRYADPTPTFNAGSFFTNQLVDITKFVTTFTFLLTDAAADGFTFTIQTEGPHALGSAGSGLGYTIDPFDPTLPSVQCQITHSFAVKFLLGAPDTARTSHLGLLLNGLQFPGFQDVDLRQGPDLDLRSGSPIAARLRYDGNALFVQLRDTVRNVTTPDFQLIAGNIAQQIHSATGKAFVGFTGATGGRSARQEVQKWDFQPGKFLP